MANITPLECAGVLALWLRKSSSAETAKNIAKEIGYNDSPFFGAGKKRVKLLGELVMINVALVIFAVNQRFAHDEAKSIIDLFLSAARGDAFTFLDERYPQFKATYEERISEYFKILHESQPALGLSFTFLQSLGMNPNNLNGQLYLAELLSSSLRETLDVLARLQLVPSR